MPQGLISTKKLVDKKVFGGKDHAKHLGKIKAFVYHPNQKRCVGFVIKRPDVALMFHRDDMFVAFDSFSIEDDGDIYVSQAYGTVGKQAGERLGVDFDTCVVWRGLPVVTEAGETIGIVGDVVYDGASGEVQSIKVDANASANALLGRKNVQTDLIRGFRTGIGTPLLTSDKTAYEEDAAAVCGGILVANEVKDIVTEGLADMAGRKAGEVTLKAKVAFEQTRPKAQEFVSTVKETASRGVDVAGGAIKKGAKVAEKKLGETRSMFSAFKEEFDKGLRGESYSSDSSAPTDSCEEAVPANVGTGNVDSVGSAACSGESSNPCVQASGSAHQVGIPAAQVNNQTEQVSTPAAQPNNTATKPRKVKKVRVERL